MGVTRGSASLLRNVLSRGILRVKIKAGVPFTEFKTGLDLYVSGTGLGSD